MSDLIKCLTAQMDEDEAAVVRAAHEHDEHWQVSPGDDMIVTVPDRADIANCGPLTSAHIARFDPARERREVEAKRAILAEHRHRASSYQFLDSPAFGCVICARNDDDTVAPVGWCATVRALAAVYSDQPEF
jgi:Family of unknown function (DUF6221)